MATDVPDSLAFLVGLKRRLQLREGEIYEPIDPAANNGPRGLAIIGSKAYVTAYFSDSLAVVDLNPKTDKSLRTILLGPKPELTKQRRGQMLFYDGAISFQHWQSCASCHPDARAATINWDLLNDGIGNPKNVKSLLLAHRTPPSMSSGIRLKAEVAVRGRIRHGHFAVRPEEDAVAIDEYLKSLKPVPSPYLVEGRLSPAAERGKKLFSDEKVGCANCHPKPLYTDLLMHDVGSKGQHEHDRRTTFDTPTLVECWRTSPYLHDGRYATVKELLAEGKHGQTDKKLGEKQLDDLVQFVLSL